MMAACAAVGHAAALADSGTALSVTVKVCAPATSAALAGNVAVTSLEVMPIVSVALTAFQFASTALTVTSKGTPAI